MDTPHETDLVDHLQSLRDLPGGFGRAFAGAAEELIRLREERDGLKRALRAVIRGIQNEHRTAERETAASQTARVRPLRVTEAARRGRARQQG